MESICAQDEAKIVVFSTYSATQEAHKKGKSGRLIYRKTRKQTFNEKSGIWPLLGSHTVETIAHIS